jgi:hypothetical protein
VSGPIFKFCAPGHVFGGFAGVGSRFHVLRSRTSFRRYRGRRLLFSCLALPDSFSAVTRVSSPVYMFCMPVLVFGGIEGVESHFHILLARTHFRQYRRRQVQLLCFALPDMFSAIWRASGLVFMFCAPRLIFDGTEGVGSRFHLLRSRTRFRRYRGRRVMFSYFALPDSFSAVPKASGPVFMFHARTFSGGTNDV